MPGNKLVIRRLPPSMNEDDFLKQVSPLPQHDYFSFFEANSGLGIHSYSRAYINFLNPDDMAIFRERFDNYVFLDKDGHEYPAVVEQSLWHKSPKNGPFHRIDKLEDLNENSTSDVVKDDIKELSLIEQDPDFIEFIENMRAQKKRPQHSPIQTLENNLDELTNQTKTSCSGKKEHPKVITPLIGFVNQRRNMKNSRKVK